MEKSKNKKISKKLILFTIVGFFALLYAGCTLVKPYDRPEIVTIEPSQTAFLIPLQGKTSDQTNFMSEQFLKEAKVGTKEIQIPHRWLKLGRLPGQGEWRRSARLILVERKPVTREWTENKVTGTSSKNEGITAESKESIGFMARMNCSAQIDEEDAVRFLYRYNNKTLENIMDTEIRSTIESKFVEVCSAMTLEEIISNKGEIMKQVRDYVLPYFKERGITITVLGLKGELTYLNPSIQQSIDAKFKAAKELEAQRDINKKTIEKAQADAEAIRLIQSNIEAQLKLKQLENETKRIENERNAIEKWDGKLPTYTGSNGTLFQIPVNK